MKSIIVAVIAVIVFGSCRDLRLSRFLWTGQLAGLRYDVQNLQQRLQKIEDASKVAPSH